MLYFVNPLGNHTQIHRRMQRNRTFRRPHQHSLSKLIKIQRTIKTN